MSGPRPLRPRVLLVSASMGAGHDGVANELGARLAAMGYATETLDFMAYLPARLGDFTRWFYAMQLRSAPRTYKWLYLALERVPVLTWLFTMFAGLARRRIARLIGPDVVAVVATYPGASQALGLLKAKGQLDIPVITFLTDFSVHPLWVSPHVDVHLALHPSTAQAARRLGARNVVVTGPVINERFSPAPTSCRDRMRAELGLAPSQHVALLVAGSWGVGDVERSAELIAESGAALPLVVCGRNEALRQRLQRRGLGLALGWRTDMPALLAASDVLIQNAGGLTCGEAFATGIPVLSYACIPGHGVANAEMMDAAGVAAWVRTPELLGPSVRACTEGLLGASLSRQATRLFRVDPAAVLDRLVSTPVRHPATTPVPDRVPARVAGRRGRVTGRLAGVSAAASLATVAALGWTATGGVAFATSHGAFVAHASDKQSRTVFVVVRPGPQAATDDAVLASLRQTRAAVAVDYTTARSEPHLVRRLNEFQLPLVNAGSHRSAAYRVTSSTRDLVRTANLLHRLTGRNRLPYLATRRLDALDLGLASWRDERILLPTKEVAAAPAELRGGALIVVDARRLDRAALLGLLAALRTQADQEGLRLGPVSELLGDAA